MARRRHIDRKTAAEGGLTGGASRLRALIAGDRERADRQREAWPELWDAIDGVVECINVIEPWRPAPGPSLFDGGFTRIPPPE